MMAATSTTAQAEPSKSNSKQEKIHIQLVRYYHAAGYIKTIGAVAHRTIYSSNPRIRHRWRGAVRYLKNQKADAERQLAVLRAPPQRKFSSHSGGFPPHHALWVCLSQGEGSPTSVNSNGHYGMLQMTYNWFGLIRGRASDYPQSVQEWAAENAYKANGYSRSFLYGQWLNYDHEYGCLSYA